ncbi:hypothetical protein J3459_012231 [Metarhizium acridum]|uniref:uncharacterized protein n=1 Tax=Metarhizium acridum TaxID=92637 RepID=UPI001C6D2716|nr:hypothetical protein J3459_012231 [Metarhizium acridum]KAG8425494.1 hypothetical protein J3458_002190 [Metarhizium acridum]
MARFIRPLCISKRQSWLSRTQSSGSYDEGRSSCHLRTITPTPNYRKELTCRFIQRRGRIHVAGTAPYSNRPERVPAALARPNLHNLATESQNTHLSHKLIKVD